MNWTNETVIQFLELYRMNPCIWDPKNASHKNREKVNNAWIDIINKLGEPCTVKELKKKKESLMSAYRSYKTKIKKSETEEAGTFDVYKPTWFAYEVMNSFLGAIYTCNPAEGSPESSRVYYDVKYIPEKKKKNEEDNDKKTFLNVCADPLFCDTDTIKNKNEDTDSDAFGTFISKKFSRISNAEQRMYAEALITKVANYAILNKLTEFTDIN